MPVSRGAKVVLVFLVVLSAVCCFAQELGSKDFDPAKACQATVSYSQSLTEWALLIFGGSVAILVGASYVRPQNRLVRSGYFLFILGWASLLRSIYSGSQVQRAYLAYLWSPGMSISEARRTIGTDVATQIGSLKWALCVFGIWLCVYLCWWILHRKEPSRST
jgi:hypothetical protein